MFISATIRLQSAPLILPLLFKRSYSSYPSNIPFVSSALPRLAACCPVSSNSSSDTFEPCANHPIPLSVGRKISLEAWEHSHYSHHVVICVGGDGPEWKRAKIESTESSVAARLAKERKEGVLVTICDRQPEIAGLEDVIVLPEFQLHTVDPEKSRLVDFVQNDASTSTRTEAGNMSNMADAIVLVCAHRMRDIRCGVLGPLIIGEFRKVLERRELLRGCSRFDVEIGDGSWLDTSKKGVEVWATSHTGGHKFAGNVIIYTPALGGHIYGNVRPCHVETLVEKHIIEGKVLKEIWRGHIGV